MLYPMTRNPTPNAFNNYVIPNGNLFCFDFTIAAGDQKVLSVVLTAGVNNQDHSLLAWVSEQPGGNVMYDKPAYLQQWHPNRTDGDSVTVYDSNLVTVSADFPFGLTPGSYVLNVLNLTNLINSFSYTLTDTTDRLNRQTNWLYWI
jgi:hypothetical protein